MPSLWTKVRKSYPQWQIPTSPASLSAILSPGLLLPWDHWGACYNCRCSKLIQMDWIWSAGGGVGWVWEDPQFKQALQMTFPIIEFENNCRYVCLLSHSGSCFKPVVLKPVACKDHLGIFEKLLLPEPYSLWFWNNWSRMEPKYEYFSQMLFIWSQSWELWQSFWAHHLMLSWSSLSPCSLPPFYHFPVWCFLYLPWTSLIPDRWDSQTVWHMKRDIVKHKKQEVTQYLMSLLLTYNTQEGHVLVTVL